MYHPVNLTFQACHARISTSTAQLGLPELQLGLIPGFGGINTIVCIKQKLESGSLPLL